VAPRFLMKVAMHTAKNYLADHLRGVKVPLILGIWGALVQSCFAHVYLTRTIEKCNKHDLFVSDICCLSATSENLRDEMTRKRRGPRLNPEGPAGGRRGGGMSSNTGRRGQGERTQTLSAMCMYMSSQFLVHNSYCALVCTFAVFMTGSLHAHSPTNSRIPLLETFSN
jgi:hypothetical protein